MLIDSNVLVYALNSRSMKCQQAQDFLQMHVGLFVVAQQNIFETLRILTHPRFESPFSTKQALQAIREIVEQGVVIFPTIDTESLVYELIKKYEIVGSEVFDAVLVATALSCGVNTIVTDNVKHLGKYQEIEVINPFS